MSEISPERGTWLTPVASRLRALAPLYLEMRLCGPTRRAGAQCSSSVGHGNFPYLCGNLNDVVVSPLLYTCYQNSQSISRAYEQYGASTIQPISEEMQLLLTVYYLVQLGESPSGRGGLVGRVLRRRKCISPDRCPSRRALVQPRLAWRRWKHLEAPGTC